MDEKKIYRLLTEDDTFQPEDEFLEDDCETWTQFSVDGKLFIGCKHNPGFFKPARRPLAPNAKVSGADTASAGLTG